MAQAESNTITVSVNDLVVGLYIDLNLKWMDHPFTFSTFKIKNDNDIKVIKSLKIKTVTVDLDKSDVLFLGSSADESTVDDDITEDVIDEEQKKLEELLWKEKEAQRERARKVNKVRKEITKKYNATSKQIQNFTKDLKNRPANAIHDVDDIVDQMASTFEGSEDMMTQLVNLGDGEHSDYNHITNVSMLSLMLGAAEGMNAAELKILGTGALLHDIGKIDLPGTIKNKKTALSPAEQKIVQSHPQYGSRMIKRIRVMDKEVLDVIEKHHELLDGSGYPNKLKANQLSKFVRIVSIVNLYDNLCNPADVKAAMAPKMALVTLYHKYKEKLDRKLVERLIGLLGVYPPGTVIRLNDDKIGLVICADSRSALKPSILIYNPEIPKDEAQIINLIDFPDLKIIEALKPGDFPDEIHQYLGIHERLGYLAESLTH
mgnify:CR=1 FL=1